MDNSNKTIGIGVISIALGAAISIIVKEYGVNLAEHWVLVCEIAGHFLVIMGEIIAVAFFLHKVIDAQIHQDHVAEIETSIELSYRKTISKMDAKVADWHQEMATKTKEIQLDLVKAILHGMGILPYQIVDLLRAEDYKPHLIRKNLKLHYEFKEIRDGILLFNQTMSFVLCNAGGEGSGVETYDMPLGLTSTPQAKYQYKAAEYKYLSNQEKKTYEVNLDDTSYPEQDGMRRLKEPLMLSGEDEVDVFQSFHAFYETKDNSIMSDIFSASNYTIGVEISVKDLPMNYSFSIYPTTLKKRTVWENWKAEKGIKIAKMDFLLPGQGFFIEIVDTTSIG
jgi:hypothetical protein